jgi:hypothetical protein
MPRRKQMNSTPKTKKIESGRTSSNRRLHKIVIAAEIATKTKTPMSAMPYLLA